MDINEVAIFIKVVQKGSFTGAAKALDMPKSTVSMKITSLEKRLGVTLIKRSTRQLRVTPQGEAFYLRTTKGLEEIQAAAEAVKSENIEPQGLLRISAPVDLGNYILPELIKPFLKKYPKVSIELLLTDRRVDFLSEGVDLAIRAGDLKDSSLIAKKIGEVEFKIFGSPKYFKEKGTPKEIKDLSSHDCISISTISSNEWKLKYGKKDISVTLPGKLIVNDMTLGLNLSLQGIGLALLPSYLCMDDVKAGKLIPILNDYRSNISPIHFVYPPQRYVPLSTKKFIEMSALLIQEKLKPL